MVTDYEIARIILARPRTFYAEAQSLRDVLGLLHGVAVGRFPWHGSGFLVRVLVLLSGLSGLATSSERARIGSAGTGSAGTGLDWVGDVVWASQDWIS
jgi:hypothetical protein